MRNFVNFLKQVSRTRSFYAISVSGLFIGGFCQYNKDVFTERNVFLTARAATNVQKPQPRVIRTERGSREDRFLEFASVECNGVIYMTPADFLESVTQKFPRYRKNRRTISEKEAQGIVNNTPRKKGSKNLFRQIDNEGLISYTEYLFLLCVVTKPKSGFKIAFKMFDADMNEEVDKKEFLVMERTMQHKKAEIIETLRSATDSQKVSESWFLLKLLNKLIVGFANPSEEYTDHEDVKEEEPDHEYTIHDEIEEQTTSDFNTTMLIYFFGTKGNNKLKYKDFAKFMEDLQTEVLEIEFTEFSKGLKTISESEFARILLRHTNIQQDKHDSIIQRIISNIPRERGVTFEDFKSFFEFLNNLDDFVLAMKMYTLADRPISPQAFQQAVKATTNTALSEQMVQTIFLLFDQDGDGHLSYHEFVKVMKNRLSRGFSTISSGSTKRSVWRRYKACVSEEFYKS